MKHTNLIKNTTYKMLNLASFMEIMHRLDIRRKFIYKTKTPVSVISRFEKMRFENLSPNLNTHYFGCVANMTCRASIHVA